MQKCQAQNGTKILTTSRYDAWKWAKTSLFQALPFPHQNEKGRERSPSPSFFTKTGYYFSSSIRLAKAMSPVVSLQK